MDRSSCDGQRALVFIRSMAGGHSGCRWICRTDQAGGGLSTEEALRAADRLDVWEHLWVLWGWWESWRFRCRAGGLTVRHRGVGWGVRRWLGRRRLLLALFLHQLARVLLWVLSLLMLMGWRLDV